MIDDSPSDDVLGEDPRMAQRKIDPRARARLEQAQPRRRGGRPRKGEERIAPGSYNTLWAPQKTKDGHPGPQHALLSCPFNEIFFGGARGGGKAIPLDENVATPTGYRLMGDIKLGDEVCAPGGDIARVVGVYPQGLERVWRILLVDGRTVRASAGHLWRLRCNGHEMTVTTDCMRQLVSDGAEVSLPVETLDHWVAVRFVWEIPPDYTQCIKVDRDDGLFVTNDDIITHNTDGAIGVWLEHAARYGQHARGMFLRRQYKQLEEVQLRCSALFPKIGATFHKGDGAWFFPNGAILKLGHLWDEAATNAYQGHQYSMLLVEELTQWPTPAAIDMMRATLRSAHGVPTRLIMTGNPGGAGHAWVRERYVTPAPAGYTPIKDPKTGAIRIYIPSRLSDNIILMKNDPNYVNNLRQAGSETLVKAWLDGDWNIVAGGFFSDILNPDKHFIDPFEIPIEWKYRRSFDWGSSRPASLGIWAVSDGNPVADLDGFVFPRGSLIRIKEWYTVAHKEDGAMMPNEGLRLTNLALGNGIAQRSLRYNFSGCVADPSIWNKLGRESIYTEMQKGASEVGHKLLFTPADNNRVAGWQKMRDMLENAAKDRPEDPGLWIFNSCKQFIRTVPVLQRDDTKPDDLDTAQEDHCLHGDTLVETNIGTVPIRNLVGVTGLVRQQDGSWRRFSDCRLTRARAETVSITTRDGRFIICTPDHRILTTDGWIEAEKTLGKIIACVQDESARNAFHQKISDGRFCNQRDNSGVQRHPVLPVRQVFPEGWQSSACGSVGGYAWSRPEGVGCPSQGRRPQEQSAFQPGGDASFRPHVPAYEQSGQGGSVEGNHRNSTPSRVSLARIARRPGMAFEALSRAYRSASTGSNGSGLRGMRRLLQNLENMAEEFQILFEQMQGGCSPQERGGQRGENLRTMQPAFHHEQVHQNQDMQSQVQRRSKMGAEVVSIRTAGLHDVFNLEVDDTHAFAVNGGLIVHNCADDTRYICMTGPRKLKVGDLSGR